MVPFRDVKLDFMMSDGYILTVYGHILSLMGAPVYTPVLNANDFKSTSLLSIKR